MSIIKAVDKDYLFFHDVFFLYIFISVSKANTHSHLSVRCPIRQNCLGVTVKCSSLLTRCFAKNSHLAVKRTTTICGFAGGGCSPITRKHASTHKILKKTNKYKNHNLLHPYGSLIVNAVGVGERPLFWSLH